MGLSNVLTAIGLCMAAALMAFALYGNDLLFLAKAMALALGFGIAFTIIYPHIRGIRKGDRVSVVSSGGLPVLFGLGRMGFALTHGGLHSEVRVKLDDGREAVGIVESYESLFSPPKVRLLYEEKLTE